MYLGRQQLGTYLDVSLVCTNTVRTPTMPTYVPRIKIRRSSDDSVVYSDGMPIVDRSLGLFVARVFLGSGFSAGQHTVQMDYLVGSRVGLETRVFEIMAGGGARGQVLGMAYFHQPQADAIVWQVESGLLLRGRNPKLT